MDNKPNAIFFLRRALRSISTFLRMLGQVSEET